MKRTKAADAKGNNYDCLYWRSDSLDIVLHWQLVFTMAIYGSEFIIFEFAILSELNQNHEI